VTREALTLTHAGLAFTAHAAGEGPAVLLLHGFPDTPATFTHQLMGLARAGYRAVAVTMRGYEPSSQPDDGDYHAVRMAEDVAAFAASLSDGRVHLIGHDWGANIAYAAASLAPDRFASLTTMAVPHPVRFAEAFAADPAQQARSAYILAFQSPGFEDQIIADHCAYLETLWKAWSPGWDIPAELLADMKAAFRKPGVARAALEYYRQAFDAVSPAAQETAALFSRPIGVPTLGICGAEDQCITEDVFLGAMRESDFPGELETCSIADAGHFCHAEQPEAVNAALIDWFVRHPA
jgi:pimeloyl-ACP methyl ester carboxylesterase